MIIDSRLRDPGAGFKRCFGSDLPRGPSGGSVLRSCHHAPIRAGEPARSCRRMRKRSERHPGSSPYAGASAHHPVGSCPDAASAAGAATYHSVTRELSVPAVPDHASFLRAYRKPAGAAKVVAGVGHHYGLARGDHAAHSRRHLRSAGGGRKLPRRRAGEQPRYLHGLISTAQPVRHKDWLTGRAR